jgi:hypothetical protein
LQNSRKIEGIDVPSSASSSSSSDDSSSSDSDSAISSKSSTAVLQYYSDMEMEVDKKRKLSSHEGRESSTGLIDVLRQNASSSSSSSSSEDGSLLNDERHTSVDKGNLPISQNSRKPESADNASSSTSSSSSDESSSSDSDTSSSSKSSVAPIKDHSVLMNKNDMERTGSSHE